jgi:ribonuclease J
MKVLFSKGQRQTVEQHPDIFGDFLARAGKRRVYGSAIHRDPQIHLCVARTSMADAVETYRGEHPVNVIYSQWKGYLDKSRWNARGAEKMASFQNDPGMIFHYVHTSGHADLTSLQAFARAVNARMLIPAHTERADNFSRHFDNVVTMQDGQELII